MGVISRIVRYAVAGTLLAGAFSQGWAQETIKNALTKGKISLDMRYRFEGVDQDGFAEDAEAYTLRTRLGYKTGTYHGFFAFAELEDVRATGGEKYNSTSNGKTQFPVVADPEDTEVNRGYLAYTGLKETTFKLGRHRITLDNLRFVGNVGWRQNEQTYDAFSAESVIAKKVNFFYAHINNANQVFGDHHPDPSLANLNLSADLINVSFNLGPGTLVAYTYLMETEDTPSSSHRNVGARYDGEHAFSDQVALLYTGEFADQSDYKDGAASVDAEYFLARVGLRLAPVTFSLGYELLGGDGVYAFTTPLATLHAMNGWADKFLVTPLNGLEDIHLSVGATLAGFKLLAVYHDFGADEGGGSYGSELDLLVSRKVKDIFTFAVKYATYDADSFATDTDKVWALAQLEF